MVEYWDVYDKNGKKKNKTIKRGWVLGQGEYHLVVEVWIRTSKDSFLIQKRSSQKNMFPNMWYCSAGGSVLAGEEPLDGILREVKEELSLKLLPKELKLKRIITETSSIFYIYLCDKIIDLHDIKIQREEVAEVAIKNIDEINKMIDDKSFIGLDYYKSFFDNLGTFKPLDKEEK